MNRENQPAARVPRPQSMLRRITCLTTLALGMAAIADAGRPAAKVGGFTQLDITRLEKELGVEFHIAFPDDRFDIDYFLKGDLAGIVVGTETVLVTCPYVTDQEVNFTVGSGLDAKSYHPRFDFMLQFVPGEGGVRSAAIHLRTDGPWPKPHEAPDRKAGEPCAEFLQRSMKFWIAAATKLPDAAWAGAGIRAAFRVAEACAPQLPALPNP